MERWSERKWPEGLSRVARERGISEEEELRQTALSLGKTVEETLELLWAEDKGLGFRQAKRGLVFTDFARRAKSPQIANCTGLVASGAGQVVNMDMRVWGPLI